MNGPWCVLGDFTAVLNPTERIGGNEVTESEMATFEDCMV